LESYSSGRGRPEGSGGRAAGSPANALMTGCEDSVPAPCSRSEYMRSLEKWKRARWQEPSTLHPDAGGIAAATIPMAFGRSSPFSSSISGSRIRWSSSSRFRRLGLRTVSSSSGCKR